MYYLQNRWKTEKNKLVYYGIRHGKNLNKNAVRISGRQKRIISSLPSELTEKDFKRLKKFIADGIIGENAPKAVPKSLEDAVFCKQCCANDFIFPAMQFDGDGLCPICASKERTEKLKSVVPIIDEIPHSKKSRFDVALFYTGGKDSTYLLYYLSEVKKLRVLALTWTIPYASENALKSIENAHGKLNNVEFVTRNVLNSDLKKIYKKLYELNGNTCACPSLAYVLFYPLLVSERVPYFIAGNEPAQMTGLFYNGMAPEIAYRFADNKFLNFLVNAGRVITLRPPLRRGQFHTLMTMKQLAYGTKKIVKLFGYRNELVENVTTAIHTIPSIVKPLKKSVRDSSASGNIPAFVQIDFNEISGGKYNWEEIKNLIIEKCGWVEPQSEKGLHTSCKIEKCKEHTQFVRFYDMKSRMIPFSAIELSIAVRDGNISREKAIEEMKTSMGLTLDEVEECKIMREFIDD